MKARKVNRIKVALANEIEECAECGRPVTEHDIQCNVRRVAVQNCDSSTVNSMVGDYCAGCWSSILSSLVGE